MSVCMGQKEKNMKFFVIFDAFLYEYDIYLIFFIKNIRNNSFFSET